MFLPNSAARPHRQPISLRRRLTGAVAGMAVGTVLAAAAPASTQGYVAAPCPAGPPPRFEDHLQSVWYRRFWTGDCTGLPAFGCASGRPYWNDVVKTITARSPTDQRGAVSLRTCRLGRRIGLEWTRPKTERRIDTTELKTLNATLANAPDVMAGLDAVEARVKAKIGG
jgi:hypothetical protein